MKAPTTFPEIKLDKLPDQPKHDAFAWVDYLELLCLFNPDREITRADAIDRIRERKDLGEGVDEGQDDEEKSKAELNDDDARRIDDLFRHLQYRAGAFKSFYPFSLSEDGDVLRTESALTEKHKLYIFLLLASNTRYFISHMNVLTGSFEMISCEVLKKMMPAHAEVHVFGSNGFGGSRYTGNLWKKVNKLADDIREVVAAKEAEFPPSDRGDNGLDIVGWVPFGDEAPNLLLVFGQCACSMKEWVQKQNSSSASAWRPTLPLKAPPSNMAFIPFCYRAADGSWHRERKIHGTILVDRLRFVDVLSGNYVLIKRLPLYAVLKGILKQRESIQ